MGVRGAGGWEREAGGSGGRNSRGESPAFGGVGLVRPELWRADARGGAEAGERLGAARHARQRVGVVQRLVCGEPPPPQELARRRPEWTAEWDGSRHTRRQLGWLGGESQ